MHQARQAILAVLLEEFTRGRTKFQESHQGCSSLHFLRIAGIGAELWLVAVFLLAPAFFIWKHRRRFDGGSLVRGNRFSARFRLARAGPRNPPRRASALPEVASRRTVLSCRRTDGRAD